MRMQPGQARCTRAGSHGITLLTAATVVLSAVFLITCNHPAAAPVIELVDSVECWVSPGWGSNTPKIVRNDRGDLWIVGLSGSYEESRTSLYKRTGAGEWVKSSFHYATYQPAMVLLDGEGRLNLFTNSQTEPVRHYRSKDRSNLDDFELVASGNGQADPRGWYLGVGIQQSRIFMAYVTLDYDFWLTWKNVQDSVWADPVKLYEGVVSPDGNHALLYPHFHFSQGRGYLMSSHTSDGSTHNFKDKVYLTSFPLHNPAGFLHEVIYECGRGYGNMGLGFTADAKQSLFCAFSGGVHHYGPVNSQALAEGIYLAVKNADEKNWSIHKIGNEKGMVAISRIAAGRVVALVSGQDNAGMHRLALKVSDDRGATWMDYLRESFLPAPLDLVHPNYFQFVDEQSGSERAGMDIFFTDDDYAQKTEKGLYRFRIYYARIR